MVFEGWDVGLPAASCDCGGTAAAGAGLDRTARAAATGPSSPPPSQALTAVGGDGVDGGKQLLQVLLARCKDQLSGVRRGRTHAGHLLQRGGLLLGRQQVPQVVMRLLALHGCELVPGGGRERVCRRARVE